jgi:phosphatidylserine/phosphatidylglycerophosphate/cardiolipin synthase-like enzyme
LNYTTGGVYKDNNNLIRIRSTQVAQDYSHEFEKMFTDGQFGPDKSASTPFPKLIIDGTLVDIYFSPEDRVARWILELVNGAQESIDFLAFSFTSNDIGDALIGRAKAGVKVRGVMDHGQVKTNQGTEYDPFQQAGLDVRLDGNSIGLMHHKVIIIDKKIVITGSYNFTNSAELSNDENMIVISNPQIAASYLDEFQKIFNQAQP